MVARELGLGCPADGLESQIDDLDRFVLAGVGEPLAMCSMKVVPARRDGRSGISSRGIGAGKGMVSSKDWPT